MTILLEKFVIFTVLHFCLLLHLTGAALHPQRLPQWTNKLDDGLSSALDDAHSMCIDGRKAKLQVIRAHGSFYDVGKQTGQQMKAQLLEFYSHYSDLNNVYLPFYSTQEGFTLYQSYFNITKKFCTAEFDELRGLADGAGVDFQKVFLMNINPEIGLYLEQTNHTLNTKKQRNQDCTTILINRAKADFAIVHNEDNDGEFSPFSYVLNANVKVDGGSTSNAEYVNFTAYSYPGMLVGNAFGFNQHGIALTSNALSPKGLPNPFGIPRYFFNHMVLLRSKTIGDVIRLIQSTPVASGFSLNVVDRAGNMANIEIAQATAKGQHINNGDNNTFDVAYVGNRTDGGNQAVDDVIDRLYHFNKYDRLHVAQIADNIMSSQHREARANALSPANTVNDAMSILGDTADLDYPIYRTPVTGGKGDQECTLATAAFDLRAKKLTIYRSNPRNVTEDDALHFILP